MIDPSGKSEARSGGAGGAGLKRSKKRGLSRGEQLDFGLTEVSKLRIAVAGLPSAGPADDQTLDSHATDDATGSLSASATG